MSEAASDTPARLGFVGTGHIASALVEGFATSGSEQILLSPRGAAHSAALAARYPRVRIAVNNQEVVDGSDVVFLGVLPLQAPGVLDELHFRSRHLLVSLVALTPIDVVRSLAPNATVVRAVPIPAARRRESPTAYFPDEPRARTLFDRVGTAFPLPSERDLSVVWSITGLISATYELFETFGAWLMRNGTDPPTARAYTLAQFRALVRMADESQDQPFNALARSAATPGGLNEQALGILREAGVFGAIDASLDAILTRLLAPQPANGQPLPARPERD
jgi:pyrroline-5-carboxylate reductase